MQNPFNLYEDDEKETKKATRKFKKLWKQFVEDWKTLQNKYSGASDTAARDAQVVWIKKHSVDIH